MGTTKLTIDPFTDLLTANGMVEGIASVADSDEYVPTQAVTLKSNTQPDLKMVVTQIISQTEVGLTLETRPWLTFGTQTDISAYLVADNARLVTNLQVVEIAEASDAHILTRASEETLADLTAIAGAGLDVPLSSRASEATATAILGQLDVDLSSRASEATLALIKAKTDNLDVLLSTRASAATQTDGTQRAQVEGRAADGTVVVGNPVLMGGQDGTNVQSLLTDTLGRPNMVGAAAQGATVAGNPILLAGEDASGNVARLQERTLPPVGSVAGQVVRQVVSQSATISTIASSATSVQLLAVNTARIGARIVNDSNKLLYVKAGTTASATDYTKLLGAGEDWLVDAGYTGRLDGIWESASGNARITEYT